MASFRLFLFGCLTLFCGLAIALPSGAGATTLPASMTLSAEPGTVTWPSQPEFDYRLEVTAGSEGADFEFAPVWAEWGLPGVQGNPWAIQSGAVLDGPGSLERAWTLVADPAPTSCFRGSFQSMREAWRLTVPPGQSTAVTIPARLAGARLDGMSSDLKIQVTNPTEGPSVTAPLTIEGPEGVRIEVEPSLRKAKRWQRFVLTGRTIPALPHQWLQVRADPRLWSGEGKPPMAHVILTVKTDGQGRFKSRPVDLGADATWVLTSKPVKPGDFDGAASCNGTIEITAGWYRPRWIDLKDSTFVSTKVKGRNLGVTKVYRRDGSVRSKKKNRLRLTFSTSKRFSPNIPDSRDWPRVPTLSPFVGCNRMGGEVSVANGRIKIDGSFYTTQMLCRPNNDSWAYRLFSKGVKATMKGRLLVLKRGKTKIVLERRWYPPAP